MRTADSAFRACIPVCSGEAVELIRRNQPWQTTNSLESRNDAQQTGGTRSKARLHAKPISRML
jgi:hypothetical protein